MADIHFEGADFMLAPEDISPELLADLTDCGGQGDAQPAVDYVLSTYDIAGNVEDCQAYLRGYGAWEEDELTDHDANLRSLVWLAGCSLVEEGEAYFSAY